MKKLAALFAFIFLLFVVQHDASAARGRSASKWHKGTTAKAHKWGKRQAYRGKQRARITQRWHLRHALPQFNDQQPFLRSGSALVQDLESGEVLYAKNSDAVRPIASLTKLMTAIVTLEAGLALDEEIEISESELSLTAGSRSRLALGTRLTRRELLHLALMSSENRAAAALASSYPGGLDAFVLQMNLRAETLGMNDTHFQEPTGLARGNVASAADLARLVEAAHAYPEIRDFSTSRELVVPIGEHYRVYRNTNALIANERWSIGLSKTGYIAAAGRCLVMQAWFLGKPIVIVLLDSVGRYTRIADAVRVRNWVEHKLSRSE